MYSGYCECRTKVQYSESDIKARVPSERLFMPHPHFITCYNSQLQILSTWAVMPLYRVNTINTAKKGRRKRREQCNNTTNPGDEVSWWAVVVPLRPIIFLPRSIHANTKMLQFEDSFFAIFPVGCLPIERTSHKLFHHFCWVQLAVPFLRRVFPVWWWTCISASIGRTPVDRCSCGAVRRICSSSTICVTGGRFGL